MNEQEMNIAVAEELGWFFVDNNGEECKPKGELYRDFQAVPPGGDDENTLPSYTTCLNACALMEEALSRPELLTYGKRLEEMAEVAALGTDEYIFPFKTSAPQRVEAFLKVKGLWTD